jgi:hypothetical protein
LVVARERTTDDLFAHQHFFVRPVNLMLDMNNKLEPIDKDAVNSAKNKDFIAGLLFLPLMYLLSAMLIVCACNIGARKGMYLTVIDSLLLILLIAGYVKAIKAFFPTYIMIASLLTPIGIEVSFYLLRGHHH